MCELILRNLSIHPPRAWNSQGCLGLAQRFPQVGGPPVGGFPEIRGTLFWGPYNKDYSICGSILGSPHFGKLPYRPQDIVSLGTPEKGPQFVGIRLLGLVG